MAITRAPVKDYVGIGFSYLQFKNKIINCENTLESMEPSTLRPNNYTQIYIQIIFAVQGRQNFIEEQNREELQKYLTGIIQNRLQKLLAIYCMPDHVHLFIGLKPNMKISDLVRDIKSLSSPFISERLRKSGKFNWQEGYGAFSYSKSQIDQAVKYVFKSEKSSSKADIQGRIYRVFEEI